MKFLSEAHADDFRILVERIHALPEFKNAEEAAQGFVGVLYDYFCDSLVLLRLFITLRYDQLPEEDRRFVDGRGRATNTSHLIHDSTPIFTLLGTRGKKPEWNDRRASAHFRCIPLASTAFVASLSMLSRQFESVGLELGLIDSWEANVASIGRADQFRGMLYIGDAGIDKDLQGRMIVPRQDFVAESGVKTCLGFGSGYAGHPTLVTMFAFTNETIARQTVEPLAALLDGFMNVSEVPVIQGRLFQDRISNSLDERR